MLKQGKIAGLFTALLGLGMLLAGPVRAEAPQIDSIVLIPDAARPSDEARGQVLLSRPAPAGGAYVHLSAGPAVWIPGTVVVPEGQTTAGFVVFFNRAERDQEVEVKASLAGHLATSNRLHAPADPRKARLAESPGPVHASQYEATGSATPRANQPGPAYGPQVPGMPAVRMPSMWDWRSPGIRR
jgi:hypothetical protein